MKCIFSVFEEEVLCGITSVQIKEQKFSFAMFVEGSFFHRHEIILTLRINSVSNIK